MNKLSHTNIYVSNVNTVKIEIKQCIADYLKDLNLLSGLIGLQQAIQILGSRTTVFEYLCLKSMIIPSIEIPTTMLVVAEIEENSLYPTSIYTIYYVGKTKENDSIFYCNDTIDRAIFYRIINDE
jgi:hypothetical protein